MKGSLLSLSVFGLSSVVLLAACSTPSSPSGVQPVAAAVETSARGTANAPFKGSFEGSQTVTPGTPPLAFVNMHAEGTGTLLGSFEIALPHTVNFATASAAGTATIVASDGSTIIASFTGQAQVGPIVTIVEQAQITGGTGRFANASGSFTIRRTFEPATGWTGGSFEGTLVVERQ